MTGLRFIGLAIRMSVAGTRQAHARVALMMFGVGIAVAVLLSGLALDHAVNARKVREAERVPGPEIGRRRQPPDSTEMWSVGTPFEGRQILVIALRMQGTGPLPPGVLRVPRPGEAFVSPAVGDVLRGPAGALLAARLGARPIGGIGSAGLLTPDEPVAYVGATERTATIAGELYEGGSKQVFTSLRSGSLVIIGMALMAFLLPVALFVVTATRLSSASRERRLAAIRLAGATDRQIRSLIALEAGVVAVAADGVGVALFAVGRSVGLHVPAVRQEWFASDLLPSVPLVAVVLLIVPLAVLAIALVGSRRIVVTPMGIVRPVRHATRGAAWILVGVLGLLLLGLDAWERRWVMARASPLPGILVVVPAGLLLLGLLGGTRWLSWIASRTIARWAPGTSLLLGSRRLEADPGSAARVVTGVALLVALLGVGQAIVLAEARDMASGGYYLAPWSRRLPDTAIVASSWKRHPEHQLRELAHVRGVSSVRLTHRVVTGGRSGLLSRAILVSDGTDATLERVRNELMWTGEADSMGFLRNRPDPDAVATRQVSRAVQAIALVLLVVTACSLLISTVDAMMERRRPIAILSAVGASTATLRRAVLVQVAVPLVIGLVLGVLVSLVTTALLFQIISEPLLLPLRPLIELATGAGVLVLLVTGVTLPWVRLAIRPEAFRTE